MVRNGNTQPNLQPVIGLKSLMTVTVGLKVRLDSELLRLPISQYTPSGLHLIFG